MAGKTPTKLSCDKQQRVWYMVIVYPCSLGSRIRTVNSGKIRRFMCLSHYLPYVFLLPLLICITGVYKEYNWNNYQLCLDLKIQCLSFLVMCGKNVYSV